MPDTCTHGPRPRHDRHAHTAHGYTGVECVVPGEARSGASPGPMLSPALGRGDSATARQPGGSRLAVLWCGGCHAGCRCLGYWFGSWVCSGRVSARRLCARSTRRMPRARCSVDTDRGDGAVASGPSRPRAFARTQAPPSGPPYLWDGKVAAIASQASPCSACRCCEARGSRLEARSLELERAFQKRTLHALVGGATGRERGTAAGPPQSDLYSTPAHRCRGSGRARRARGAFRR